MAFWMVRGGKNEVFYDRAVEDEVVILGFEPLGDLSAIHTREKLRECIQLAHPGRSNATVTRWSKEIGSLHFGEIQAGDIIVMPYARGRQFTSGRWTGGPYRFLVDEERGRHTWPVEWHCNDENAQQVPERWRSAFREHCTVKKLSNEIGEVTRNGFDTAQLSREFSEVVEGRERLEERRILRRLRNRTIATSVWQENFTNNGGIGRCEGCDFKSKDRGMFDIHHHKPLALMGERKTRPEELSVLCPRCHRYAHRGPDGMPHPIGAIREAMSAQV
jgi:predicted Mrr-cat superfamily restriction endonuclease